MKKRSFIPLFLVLAVTLIKSASVIAAEVRYDKGGRRDPFVPLVGADGKLMQVQLTARDLNIEGVIYDPNGGSVVLVNGEAYKEGENIDKATIISIMKDRVILSQANQEKIIWLRDEVLEEKLL